MGNIQQIKMKNKNQQSIAVLKGLKKMNKVNRFLSDLYLEDDKFKIL